LDHIFGLTELRHRQGQIEIVGGSRFVAKGTGGSSARSAMSRAQPRCLGARRLRQIGMSFPPVRASIQNNSGLPKGFAGPFVAG
jgi:hypothetical protein